MNLLREHIPMSSIVLTRNTVIVALHMGKPVLVLRHTTERPEAIEAGTVKLIGPVYQRILEETERLLHDEQVYDAMARAINPYGDGQAAQRIVSSLCDL